MAEADDIHYQSACIWRTPSLQRPNHAYGRGQNHSTKTGGRKGGLEGGREAGGRDSQKTPRSETVMSLMSELLSARRWTRTVDRSRGVNAPFACLAPNSNPVPGVRLTIAAIAVAKKKHHKSLIDAATHITYIVCM